MSTNKKIAFSCIAFLILSSYFFVPYLIFKVKQTGVRKEIKKAIKAGIPKSEMLRFSEDDIKNVKWEKTGKEFWLNGDIFDIVKTETEDGKIYYWCINDNQEKQLFATLNNIVGKHMNEKNKLLVKKIPVLQLYYENTVMDIIAGLLLLNTNNTVYILKHYLIYNLPNPLPPEQSINYLV